MLGQWRNFDELEEWLTLDELIEAFNAIIDRENRRMEFDARLAGAEMGDKQSNNKQADTNTPTLADKLKARKQQEREGQTSSKTPTEFSQGVGYQVIGG